MKTAISIPDDIFEEVDKFAKKHHYSRSEVFLIAVKELLERIKSRQLLDTLNELYDDIEAPADKTLRDKARKHYSKSVLKEPY